MIQAVNAPIHFFMEYVNQFFPSDEEVVIIVVDEDFENDCGGLVGEDKKTGDRYLGRYWRQKEDTHVILVRKELSVFDTVGVLAHEYVHHLMWNEKMLKMSDAEIHDLPKFDMLWDGITAGCMEYIEENGTRLGFVME